MSDTRPTVGVTMGDPAGIGPEIVAAGYPALCRHSWPVVVGDADVIDAAIDVVGADLTVERIGAVDEATDAPGVIPVLDQDAVDADSLTRGEVRAEYGAASLAYVERAIDLAIDGEIEALVTAPINKQATELAGSEHAGHTGLLAERTGTDDYAMMLVESDLRVTHVSTHVPLREACDLVTTERVLTTIELTADALADLGVAEPTVAVAGLNPHAGDGGLMGDEETTEIEPAVERARAAGIDAVGPEPPDTVYVRAAEGAFDCVVSMYHDQGHIPIKTLGFAGGNEVSGVNATIGLPIVRTSVDHGTAFDIAGEGVASERSLLDAVDVAVRMAAARDRSG